MTVNSLDERRRYVNEVRASFGSPHESRQYGNLDEQPKETTISFTMFKIKFLVAVIIFAGFIYCDLNKITWYGQNTKTVTNKIKETVQVDSINKSIKDLLP
jgi:hypothetical protein